MGDKHEGLGEPNGRKRDASELLVFEGERSRGETLAAVLHERKELRKQNALLFKLLVAACLIGVFF